VVREPLEPWAQVLLEEVGGLLEMAQVKLVEIELVMGAVKTAWMVCVLTCPK
jgi:hypothetical protein